MPQAGSVTFDSFVGGVDLGVPAYKMRPGFVPTATNMYNVSTGVRGRYGTKSYVEELYGTLRDEVETDTGAQPYITGIHMWSRRAPVRETELFVGTADSIGHYVKEAGHWEELLRGGVAGAGLYEWSDAPWHFIQYNGIMYAFREGVGMRRVSNDPRLDLQPGIDAPLTNAALNNGAAGATEAAGFYLVYTFRNSQTGQESNPSAISALYNAPGALKVNASSVDVSDNPQVDSRRLYVTLPHQTGAYYFWQDIPNNTDTTSADLDIIVANLGEPASFRNARPPQQLLFGVIWQERLWASDGRQLYASELGFPESMPAQNVLSIFPDDGEDITGLAADENRLYVGRTSKVIYLTGTVSNLERHVLDDKNGVASHGSLKLIDNRLIWFTGSDFVMSEGGPGRSLTTGEGGDGTRLDLYTRYLDRESARKTVAEVWPEGKLYVFLGRWSQSAEQDSVDGHPHRVLGSDMLALNYETGSDWWPWRFFEFSAHSSGLLQPSMALKLIIDADGEQKLLSGYRTAVNHLLAPNYNHDDIVRGGNGAVPARITAPIVWELGLPEVFQPGAVFGPRRVGLAGLLHRFPLGLTLMAFRGGRYIDIGDLLSTPPYDLVSIRTHTYPPDPFGQTTGAGTVVVLGRDNDYEWFNLGSTSAGVPRLFVFLRWIYAETYAMEEEPPIPMVHAIQAPPLLTSATLDLSSFKRKKRPV